MESFVLGLQVLLAVVFATAGIAKLLDQSGSRQALIDFGVPKAAVPLVGLLLPLAELAVAAALVLHPSARWGALAAMALLLAFVGGITRALARGESPDCHCFGQLHSAPAGRGALARNAALALVAAIIVWQGPGAAIDDWLGARSAAELMALGTVVAAAALGAFELRRRLSFTRHDHDGEILDVVSSTTAPGLPVGAEAPDFSLPDVDGTVRTLESLRDRGQPLALVFASPSCGSCEALFTNLGRWQATLADRLTIAVLSSGSATDNELATEVYRVSEVLLQRRTEVMDAYRVRSTPSAVVVAPDGTIASTLAEGTGTIEALIRLEAQGPAYAAPIRPEQS